jgi:hypothetical protein
MTSLLRQKPSLQQKNSLENFDRRFRKHRPARRRDRRRNRHLGVNRQRRHGIRRFSIVLPSGKKLITLRDTAEYITGLPKAEHDTPQWQAAMQALLLVAEQDGPTILRASAS